MYHLENNESMKCRKCSVDVESSVNISPSRFKRKDYLCNPCHNIINRKYQENYSKSKQGIYEIHSGNISLYIGQSIRLTNRINKHKTFMNNIDLAIKHSNKHESLYFNLQKHNNVSIRIIEECSPEVLLEREQHYIDTIKPLYNEG